MKISVLSPALGLALLPFASLSAQGYAPGQGAQAEAEFAKAAEAAAAPDIAEHAAIARMEPSGKVTQVRPGTNGFTCTILPDGSNAPFCGDKNAFPWIVAAMSKQAKPPSSQPGVAYMAKGGVHYETPEGLIVMAPGPKTKEVKEPPHWMLTIPLDSAKTGIPTKPNPGGTYIMFAGTPYAHLMIYQDPKMLHR
jgi:hypothetical protein